MKTKTIIYLIAACFLSGLLILQTACKKDEEEEPPPGNPVVLNDNTKIIDETLWEDSYESLDSSTYTYIFNNNIESLNLKVGDVMASNAGNGFLRKVTNVTIAKGETEVETEQASLEDAIESGDVILDTPLDIDDIESIHFNYPGISLAKRDVKQNGDLEFTLLFNFIFEDLDGDTTTTDDQIKIQGHCTFTWQLITKITYKVIGGLKYVKCGFISDQELVLNFIATTGYVGEVDLAEIIFNKKDINVGPVTVPLKPKFELLLGVDLSANLELNASVVDNLHFDAYVEYKKNAGGWGSGSEITNTIDFSPPSINGSIIAKAYVKPKLTVLVYGIKGPYVYAEGYLKTVGQFPNIPNWAAYTGFNTGVGAKAEIFGGTLFNFEVSGLIAKEWLIVKGPTPTVTTSNISNIEKTTATGGGNVTDQGSDGNVIERGVCWSTSPNPDIYNSFSSDGAGGGSFTSELSNLSVATTYYVRAYATNSHGTDYGDEVEFETNDYPQAIPCPGIPTVTYEGQTYNTVQIGNQCWFKENLNVGTMIDYDIINSPLQANNGQIEKYCFGNQPENCATDGGLYQWDEMMQYTTNEVAKGICPPGWHLPTDAEWTTLTVYLDNTYGGNFDESMVGESSNSGFNALQAGWSGNGDFGGGIYFWTSTELEPTQSASRHLNNPGLGEKEFGYSVRCVKD